MLQVYLAKNLEGAIEITKLNENWVAIETEYGDQVLDNSYDRVAASLNHHGHLQGEDPPALAYKHFKNPRYDNFIISHIDLDVLFGILWMAGWLKVTPVTKKLSDMVAQADKFGFHTLKETLEQAPKKIRDMYLTIGYLTNSWIIKDNGATTKDVSKEIHKLLLRIKDVILNGATPDQINQYEEWLDSQAKTVKKHLVQIVPLCNDNKLLVYRAPFKLTTVYMIGDKDIVGEIIVQYHEQSKSITLGCINDEITQKYFGDKGVIEPLQIFFGSEAGGKFSIGGSPRNMDLQPEILSAFVEFLKREYFNIPQVIKMG
jgi:hypothetical protein